MKKWISVLLALFLACTACLAFAEEDTDALVDRGNEALNAEDYATALELYTRAADAGNTRAMGVLGVYYGLTAVIGGSWKASALATLLAVGFGVVLYGVMILMTKAVTLEEIERMPKGKKLARLAAKIVRK